MRTALSTSRTKTSRAALAAAVGLGVALAGLVTSPASAAEPEGCGRGSAGPFAETLCWIDMTAYDDAQARDADGQPMSISLPGGYTASFSVHTSGTRSISSSPFPTWTFGDRQGATVGNDIYLGTPGRPALYQNLGFGAESTTISLRDISVADASGAPVHGWQIVGVDAEGTAGSESITFSADRAVRTLASYEQTPGINGCQRNITQVDANTISCTGELLLDDYGTVLVASTEPTVFSQTMTVDSAVAREGVAFAFQSATIQADVAVVGGGAAPAPLTVSVLSPESMIVGSATSTGETASTGALTVLPRTTDDSPYRLSLAGADLAAYAVDWSCTVNGAEEPALGADGAAAIAVAPEPGDAIACTATATLEEAPVATPAPTAAPGAAPGGAAPSAGPDTLPATGGDAEPVTSAAGLALLSAGVVLVALARLRRPSTAGAGRSS